MLEITNPKNQRIKDVQKLEKASERKRAGQFVVEGLRENILAKRAGYSFQQVFVCTEMIKETDEYNLLELEEILSSKQINVSPAVYQAMAYRESTEGIIGVLEQKENSLSTLILKEKPLLLVIESVEKPGNLGAMFRTADAVGIDAVILCDTATDVYNPNVIRSSIGTVFTNQIAIDSTGNVIDFLTKLNIKSYAAFLGAEKTYFDCDFTEATAIVVGAESSGLSAEWIVAASEKVIIPMQGEIDSLNVSVAAALFLYEGLRQRR